MQVQGGGGKKVEEAIAPGDHWGSHNAKHTNKRTYIGTKLEIPIPIEVLPSVVFFRINSKLQTHFKLDAIAGWNSPRCFSTYTAIPNQGMGEHENTSVRLVGIWTPAPTRLYMCEIGSICRSAFLSWEISTVLVFKWPSWTYKPKSRDVLWVFTSQDLSSFYSLHLKKYNIIGISSINCFRAAMARNFQTAPNAKSRKISQEDRQFAKWILFQARREQTRKGSWDQTSPLHFFWSELCILRVDPGPTTLSLLV